MPDKSPKSILVVDNDLGVLQNVERALRSRGYQVQLATDGALAINRALAAPPNLILSAVEMPLLSGFKLCKLLRTNPVTRDIPFIFLTSKKTSPLHLGKFLRSFDDFILKPFKEKELVGRIDNLFLLQDKVQEVSGEEQQAFLGTLTEISLVDLLQILRMNRRSGLLVLENEGQRGSVSVKEGHVINAEVKKFKGEKAFFRLLSWESGKFEFRPQPITAARLIQRPGENLILEGLRQLDELKNLKKTLAGDGSRLELAKHFQGPPERLRPITREILNLLGYFSTLDDLLDQSAYGDLEICETLKGLIEKKIVSVATPRRDRAAAEAPLLPLEDALKLSYHLGVGREEGPQLWAGKVLLFATERDLLQRFLEGVVHLKEFKIDTGMVMDPHAVSVPVGPVGTFQIFEGTELCLYSFSGEAAYQPLWESLSHGTIGSLILTRRFPPFPEASHFCDATLRSPFLICGPGLKEEKKNKPGKEKWKPTVAWSTAGYQEGNEESHRATFGTLFSLILKQ